MATQNLTIGGTGRVAASDSMYKGPFVLARVIDAALASPAYPAADVLQLINVPAATFVQHVLVQVLTAEGGVATGDLGDGADPNGYFDAIDFNSAGDNFMALALTEAAPNTVTGYSNGKYYAAADTIDLTLDHELDACKFRVAALCFYLGSDLG